MYITSINPYQGLQNAIRPGGLDTPGANQRDVSSAGRAERSPATARTTSNPVAFDIGERITALVRNLDLTLVHFPPFFPIATYQRMDLIEQMTGIAQDIIRADMRPEFTQAADAAVSLTPEADDAQIAHALDKLLEVRDTLARQRAQPHTEVQPGAILELEI
jgi:hypothetical protein